MKEAGSLILIGESSPHISETAPPLMARGWSKKSPGDLHVCLLNIFGSIFW